MLTSIRTLAKNSLSSNLLLYDRLIDTVYREYNKSIVSCVHKFREIDSIQDFAGFRETMLNTKFPSISGTYTVKRAFSENTLYGYAESIMAYAGICCDEALYMPIVFHGIPYDDDFEIRKFGFHNSFIFQGVYDTVRVLGKYPHKTIHSVGPYLYYCKPYYEEPKLKQVKNQIGKAALVFLSHSSEGEKAHIQVDRTIERVLSKTKAHFDTFLVCVYCQDVHQLRAEDVDTPGIKYVSAGFKLDPLFCSRLKTIISLADVVFFDGFSSSIGYAHLLGKQIVSLMPENSGVEGNARQSEFHRLFCVGNDEPDELRSLYIEKYWGTSQIKSQTEIRKIFQDNKDRIIQRKGFFI